MMIDSKLWVRSPWYGVLEIVGEPGVPCTWGTTCWNGKDVADYVTETLQPLTDEAASMLGVSPAKRVWDEAQVQRWNSEPIDTSVFAFPGGF